MTAEAWLFSDRDLAAAFRLVCKTWDRTPFRPHSCAKGPGGGIDCVGFAEAVFCESGAAPRFHFPRSDADYKSHAHNDKILRFLRGSHPDPQSTMLAAIFAELTNLDELVPIAAWPKQPAANTGLMTGDLLVIKAKIPGVWHLPVMLNDRTFMHCAYPLGVMQGDITQADYRSRLEAVFRCRVPVN